MRSSQLQGLWRVYASVPRVLPTSRGVQGIGGIGGGGGRGEGGGEAGGDNEHRIRIRRQLPMCLLPTFCPVDLALHASGTCVGSLGSEALVM